MNYSRQDSERDRTPVDNFNTGQDLYPAQRWDITNNDYVDFNARNNGRAVQRDNLDFTTSDGRNINNFHIDHATFYMGGGDMSRIGGNRGYIAQNDWDSRPSFQDMTYQNMLRQQIRPYRGGDPSLWGQNPGWDQGWNSSWNQGVNRGWVQPRQDAVWAGPNGVGVVSSNGWDGYRDPNPIRQFNREVGMPLAETAAVAGVIGSVVNMFRGGNRGYYGRNSFSPWQSASLYGNSWNGGNQWNNWQYANGPQRYNWGSGFNWG